MSKRPGRDLLEELEDRKLLDYGKFVEAKIVQDNLGIIVPETGSKREYDQLALQEMAAVDYVRNVLLGRGMYIRGVAGGYRILTISENMEQVEQYLTSADRKLSRGIKLMKNSPKQPGEYPDQQEARAEMKRENIRDHRRRRGPPQASA